MSFMRENYCKCSGSCSGNASMNIVRNRVQFQLFVGLQTVHTLRFSEVHLIIL